MKKDSPFHVQTRMPAGNACRVRMEDGNPPELHFSVEPKGGRPVWFYFGMKTESPRPAPPEKLKVVLHHYDTLAGAHDPVECVPLFRLAGQWWTRMQPGTPERTPDGRTSASWMVNHPPESFEIALGYPYTDTDLKKLVEKKDGVWMRDPIGLSREGRTLFRLSNSRERSKRLAGGLYVIARERGCDMPAAWVLDGFLQRLAAAKNNPFLIWTVPEADTDGARFGRGVSEPDLHTGWDAGPYELDVIRQDLTRWRARCSPALGLSILAAEVSETTGIYCSLPNPDRFKDRHEQAKKWAHVIEKRLGKDFASPEFIRSPANKGGLFHDWLAGEGLCGLTLHIPWANAGGTVFSPKKYREAGRNIADGLIEKRK